MGQTRCDSNSRAMLRVARAKIAKKKQLKQDQSLKLILRTIERKKQRSWDANITVAYLLALRNTVASDQSPYIALLRNGLALAVPDVLSAGISTCTLDELTVAFDSSYHTRPATALNTVPVTLG